MLAELRSAWLYGEAAAPIERLSLLGNGRSLALLTPDATVCWQCVPEPTSGAVFAHLLGGAPAGYFSVRPEQEALSLGQRYVSGTMTLETRWPGLLVTDYLDRYAEAHRTDLIRVISGSAPAVVEFAPRPEFGQVMARIEARPDGLVVAGPPARSRCAPRVPSGKSCGTAGITRPAPWCGPPRAAGGA
jgi:trehalose 6-phosphate phosphatase